MLDPVTQQRLADKAKKLCNDPDFVQLHTAMLKVGHDQGHPPEVIVRNMIASGMLALIDFVPKVEEGN